MLTTKEEIKKELLDNIEQLKDNPHAEDLVAEFADSWVPIYNNHIIEQWVALPMEESDQWKEYGYDTQRNEGGIISLMQVDLVFYYLKLGREAWEEIKTQLEEEESN
jgi:hypothetical protein